MEKNPTQNKAMTEVTKKKEGNTMHIESEIQQSEMAFHQGWQKQGINSLSLQCSNLANLMMLPRSFMAKDRKTGKTIFGSSRHFPFWHSWILDITKSPGHYDKYTESVWLANFQ